MNPNSHTCFQHDLGVKYIEGSNSTFMLCCHGFGQNSQKVIDRVHPHTTDHLISFNSIDYDFDHETGDDKTTMMATPMETMPLLHMLKSCVVDGKLSRLSLYGYALGGANIIQALSFLTTDAHDSLLEKYGISTAHKKQIMDALEGGSILLDVPFKSIEEIIDLRGPQETLLMYQERAKLNQLLSPLLTLTTLNNLKLNFLVFFDKNNKVFSNKDDDLFFKNLAEANKLGKNILLSNDDQGHFANHPTLWESYSNFSS